MNLAERAGQLFAGRIFFPLSNHLLNRKNILGRYRGLLVSERASRDALQELQFQQLAALVRSAYRWSPYYARRFKENGLEPGDIRTPDDIRKIPRLVRADVVENGLDLVDFRFRSSVVAADQATRSKGLPPFARFRRNRLVRNSSSGSTGTPTVFYEDGSTTALNWAHELRLKRWFGLEPGAKEARMSATPKEYAAFGAAERAREWLWNQAVLPGYFLSDVEYEICVKRIGEFRPRILWGPTQALTGLARYLRQGGRNIGLCRPELLISRAAPLHAPENRLLSDVFSCPVTNIYGTREVGHIAMTCPHGSMHVNEENYFVEVAHDEGASRNGDAQQSGAGPGKILVTPLFESPMPFLRYEIGDLVELGGAECTCGRTLLTLKKVLGRIGDVFRTPDGHLIEPNFWCIAFEEGRLSRDVEKFQVVYERRDAIRIRLVPRSSYSTETEHELRRFLAANVSTGIQFELERVSDIPPKPSGKYLFVVNEMGQDDEQSVLS